MRTTACALSFLLTILSGNLALAKPEAPDPATVQRFNQRVASFSRLPIDSRHQRHGKRAFVDAKAFAKKNDLPFFEMTLPNGQKRLVMNLYGQKNMKKYCQKFSDGKCYLENFFSVSWKDRFFDKKPAWSHFRAGEKTYDEYGPADSYMYTMRNNKSMRIAFPYSVTKSERDARLDAIENTPTPPFDAPFPNLGGIFQGKFLANCTDWITAVVHGLTGIKTNSVNNHAHSLMFARGTTERMSVMTVITKKQIENFNADLLRDVSF